MHLEGEEDPSGLGLEEAGAVPVGPLRYSLDVGVSGDGLFATGSLRVRVRMTCVVSLEPFERDIEIEGFAMQKELGGSELVDLTPEIREDIHLALPAHPRSDAMSDGSPFASTADQLSVPLAEVGRGPWEALEKIQPNH